MKYKSLVFTEASGSIGGMTYSHNKGGLYVRARTIPVNPATPFQEIVRNATAFLTDAWITLLTPAQRLGWETYAANVTIPDRLGAQMNLPPISHYVRSNVSRMQQGLPRVDAAPVSFTLGGFTSPTFTYVQATSSIVVAFDDTDLWVDKDDAAMLVYVSREQNPTIKYFKGPYRLAGAILGDALLPPTTPATIVSPFPAAVDNLVFARVRVTRDDGRLSLDFRDFATSA